MSYFRDFSIMSRGLNRASKERELLDGRRIMNGGSRKTGLAGNYMYLSTGSQSMSRE